MTAEVAIINRHAIALAADSAVTVGRDKVWKTANKLFSMGPNHDIAIMVYGSGDYLGLSWELIVKEFRRQSKKERFPTVESCAAAFKAFLTSKRLFNNEDQQGFAVLFPVFDVIDEIKDQLISEGVPTSDAKKILHQVRKLRLTFQRHDQCITALNEAKFKTSFEYRLKHFATEMFDAAVADVISEDVVGLAMDFFRSKAVSNFHSGIVVAGYGSEEFYPALSSYIVDGSWDENLRWWDGEKNKNLNTTDHHDSFPIVPFAQDDMSFQFMAGISPDILDFIGQALGDVVKGAFDGLLNEFAVSEKKSAAKQRGEELSNQLVSAFMKGLIAKVRKEQFEPINKAVSALPKEEMATFAESLVELTALKRRFDSPLESVGGAVDVAIISKGDGFIWIKRKHYFNADKNMDLFRRRLISHAGEGHE